jgi:hypothetical protein
MKNVVKWVHIMAAAWQLVRWAGVPAENAVQVAMKAYDEENK